MDKAAMGSRGSIGKCEMSLCSEEGPKTELRKGVRMPKLPKSLTSEEKKYLLAVERGDTASVRRMLQKAMVDGSMDINCVDPLGRGALLMAIEAEQLAMVELLIVMGVKTADALLHAIDREFVEAVELLLEHEELVHKEGEPYSWENIDRDTATFTPEITPLILAAHRNNYEIVKILLDRGATLPMPHDIRCGCEECIEGNRQDCLRHSASRINSYKALASSSLIALTSTDPLLTAFELSWELKQLSFSEPEFRGEYLELRKRTQEFAVALLSHTRTSHELQVMLNFDPNIMKEDDESLEEANNEPNDIHEGGLARLRLAISYKQKKFVSHSWVQQLLASIWYEGLPGFRQKSGAGKAMEVGKVVAFAPFYCLIYMLAPSSQTGRLIRKPFMKFLVQTSSYLFFLLILILVSQRFEEQLVDYFEYRRMQNDPDRYEIPRKQHRGLPPRVLELFVVFYVLGFIWEETRELKREGFKAYVCNLWNAIDFLRNSTYVTIMFLRTWAYIQQTQEIAMDPEKAYIPREEWDDYDPQLIAEGLFAAANVFSALKLVHTSSINPHLGPLQISLGRMIVDILKFFFFYSLVLFAFACGLNQLLWYFADLEKAKCYSLPGGLPDWKGNGEACMKWRRFGNLFESSQSLFWASFGMVGLDDFELTGIKSYTRFWGLLMFGSYSVINVIVLLNLLIAMMSNSYAMITEKADTEWKFARTTLWLSYFDEDSTLPSPFNLIPTPKQVTRLLGCLIQGGKSSKNGSKAREARLAELKEQAREYTAVMRALVWRYISGMHRKKEEESVVTEDDVNEIKGEISTLRCDLVEMFRTNGMNVMGLAQKQVCQSRKTREWERRLFRGFHVAPAAGDDTILLNVQMEAGAEDGERRVSETGADKFKRMARLALLNRERLARPPKHLSHIGRSTSNESFKSRQSLKQAMDAAKKMVKKTGGEGGENASTSGAPPPATEENLDPKDRSGSGSTVSADRKDSTLSMVAESVASGTPGASFGEGEGDDNDDDGGGGGGGGTEEQEGGRQISLMDEPLPEIMSTVKATSPQQKLKGAVSPPKSLDNDNKQGGASSPTPSAKLREEQGRVSKSVLDKLSDLPGSAVASDTTISMENETRSVDSPIRASSRLSVKSGSGGSETQKTSPSGSPSPLQKLYPGQTIEVQDSVSVKVQPPTITTPTTNEPFGMKGATKDDKVPLISADKQEVIISPATLHISSTPSKAPTVTIVASASPSTLAVGSSPQTSTSPNSSLQIVGQKIEDVKTIKRPKPGGSWF